MSSSHVAETRDPAAGSGATGGRGRVAAVAPYVPRQLRHLAGVWYGRRSLQRLRRKLAALQESDAPVLLGPYLSEVGFEILYWLPFLRWLQTTAALPVERLIAVSRGGAGAWYRSLTGSQMELFDLFSVEEYRRGNAARVAANRGQKSMAPTAFDREVAARCESRLGARPAQLHPSLMFRLFRPYFWEFTGIESVLRHTAHERLARSEVAVDLDLPERYVAAKFYFNDGLPDGSGVRDWIRRLLERIGESLPIVLLDTGLAVDDHREYDRPSGARLISIRSALRANDNLGVQSAVLAKAQAFVGTYGGFSYIAPGYGVPAVAAYSRPHGFHDTHLRLAKAVFDGRRLGELRLADATAEEAEAVADRVLAVAREPERPVRELNR